MIAKFTPCTSEIGGVTVTGRILKKHFRADIEAYASTCLDWFGSKPNKTQFVNGLCAAWQRFNRKRRKKREPASHAQLACIAAMQELAPSPIPPFTGWTRYAATAYIERYVDEVGEDEWVLRVG